MQYKQIQRTVDKALGTHMGMWRLRQTGRQTETLNHFSTDPLTLQSFQSNHGLVNPKQR